LYDQVRFIAFKWQRIHKTGIVFNITFLKLFNFFTLGIVADRTAGKTATKN